MKKLFSLLLVLILVFSFSACGKKDTSSDSDSVDLEYFAKLGKMPESTYSLGESIDKIQNELSEKQDREPESAIYNVTEGEKSVLIENGAFSYYYVKENKNNGISYIVDYDKAFGFELGTINIEVSKALSQFKVSEYDANEDKVFFVNGVENLTVQEYKINNYIIMFIFQDNGLYATAMYDPANWNL